LICDQHKLINEKGFIRIKADLGLKISLYKTVNSKVLL